MKCQYKDEIMRRIGLASTLFSGRVLWCVGGGGDLHIQEEAYFLTWGEHNYKIKKG